MERFAFLLFCVLATAACTRYEPVMGPFDGTIVDAVTGKPISGAFVGFVWNGQVNALNLWSQSHGCLNAVLVQTDSDGHYAVPTQKFDFDMSLLSEIGWVQTAWAPGYLLAEATAADSHGNAMIYSHQPGVSYEDGADRMMHRNSDRVTARDMKLRLYASSSPTDALDYRNRMQLINYYCGASEPRRAKLAKALYMDSFKRICLEKPPPQALEMRYVLTPSSDFSKYVMLDSRAAGTPQSTARDWKKFNRDAGLEPPPIGSDANAMLLNPQLLPELCRLSSPVLGTAKETP